MYAAGLQQVPAAGHDSKNRTPKKGTLHVLHVDADAKLGQVVAYREGVSEVQVPQRHFYIYIDSVAFWGLFFFLLTTKPAKPTKASKWPSAAEEPVVTKYGYQSWAMNLYQVSSCTWSKE